MRELGTIRSPSAPSRRTMMAVHFLADADIDADGANGQNGAPAAHKADDSGTELLSNGGMKIVRGKVVCAQSWARNIVILNDDNEPKVFPGGIIASMTWYRHPGKHPERSRRVRRCRDRTLHRRAAAGGSEDGPHRARLQSSGHLARQVDGLRCGRQGSCQQDRGTEYRRRARDRPAFESAEWRDRKARGPLRAVAGRRRSGVRITGLKEVCFTAPVAPNLAAHRVPEDTPSRRYGAPFIASRGREVKPSSVGDVPPVQRSGTVAMSRGFGERQAFSPESYDARRSNVRRFRGESYDARRSNEL
jgi:hypothetical protein